VIRKKKTQQHPPYHTLQAPNASHHWVHSLIAEAAEQHWPSHTHTVKTRDTVL